MATIDFQMAGEPYCVVDETNEYATQHGAGRIMIYKYQMVGPIKLGRVPLVNQPKLYDAYLMWRKTEGNFAGMELGEFMEKMVGDVWANVE